MKSRIVRVNRNSFINKNTGEEIAYCKIGLLTKIEETVDECGYEYKEYTISIDMYDFVRTLLNKNVDIDVHFEFKELYDGNYKKRICQINDTSL